MRLKYDLVTIARSVDGGYTELQHAYIAQAMHDPNDPPVHYHLALMYSEKGQYTLALDYAERAVRLDPIYEGGMVELGRSLAARGQTEGLAFLARAEALTPGSHLVTRARDDLAFDRYVRAARNPTARRESIAAVRARSKLYD